ncbi:MAG: phenylalanine--tRNA ligase subunit alpha [Candidatus Woesearchaeota archaeon]|nr:MAG: phenylalanine--tRNA ligase subunit alpha [Candidatus Woesearchaeota archaeon]
MASVVDKLHQYEILILRVLTGESFAKELSAKTGLQDIEVMRGLQWLSNKELVILENSSEELIALDVNGVRYKENGLPERRLLQELAKGEKKASEITSLEQGELNISIGALKSKAAIETRKDGELILSITDPGKRLLEQESFEEKFLGQTFPLDASSLAPEMKFAYDNLMKRKNIIKKDVVKTVRVTLTGAGKTVREDKRIFDDTFAKGRVDRITQTMLKTGSWKGKEFRSFDVSINVPEKQVGKPHIISETTRFVKKIWLSMGFEEMQGAHVQSAFWDLDALFVPQDHPAREMQDTFYLKDPSESKLPPPLLKAVKALHETGGETGSKGWGGKFEQDISKKNLLRTHTTVLTARKLFDLKKEDLPKKFFSVGKVYRNEALDWKHLFEFYQVEGIVIDPQANLKHLLGYLTQFYGQMGFSEIKLLPAYFPYVEPACEVHGFSKEKKQWIELGGSGMIRPEVSKVLLGFEAPILAWGLGLERIITLNRKISDIRHLYATDMSILRKEKKFFQVST